MEYGDPETIQRHRRRIAKDTEEARQTGKVQFSDLKTCLIGTIIDCGWPGPAVLGTNEGEEPPAHLQAEVDTWPKLNESNVNEYVKSHRALGADYIKLMQEDCVAFLKPKVPFLHASFLRGQLC